MPVTAKIDEVKKTITITMDLSPNPEPSKSGKSLNIASTQGNKKTEAKYKGKQIVVGAFAYVPNN